jgi:NAD(P)-dependent dehydrogenase (short-subunit alcohol dehydrogenase family)
MDRNREFAGKAVVISGAGSGIGLATAGLIARLGGTVAIADIDLGAASRAADDIRAAGGDAHAFHVDAGDAASVGKLIDDCVARFGRIAGAVNNAAIPGPRVPMAEYPLEDWRRVIEVDLNGVFYALRAEILAMRKTGGGAIVNIASIVGTVGAATTGPYSAAKHAVVGMTRTAALEEAANNIRINAVGPGYVETPFIMNRAPALIESYRAKHPMGRLATVADIAEVVVFLLSDRAGFTTGSIYLSDGGFTAQ